MTPPLIREAVFGDYPQVAALESALGLVSKPYEEWLHLWADNPAYKALEGWPIGWVLEDENGCVVGYVGNIPLFYEFRGRRLVTAAGRAWTVDPRYRSFGLLLMETYFEQPRVDLFLNTTVNSQAQQAFSVFESARAPKGDWDSAGFWVTHYRGFARSVARMKGLPAPASYPLAAVLRVKSLAHRLHAPEGIRVEECDRFDRRFDEFWDRLRCSRPNALLGVRTAEALAWHFEYPLRKGELRIATVSDDSGLAAYAIFMRRDVPEIGLERARLADFQQVGNGGSLLPSFLAWAIERYRDERVHAVEVVGGRDAPFHRQLPAWCYYYKPADPSLAEALSDPDAWSPSSFDGDASL